MKYYAYVWADDEGVLLYNNRFTIDKVKVLFVDWESCKIKFIKHITSNTDDIPYDEGDTGIKVSIKEVFNNLSLAKRRVIRVLFL
jgi:hypothetical protein